MGSVFSKFMKLKIYVLGLERWLSSLLLFQKTKIQFPALSWWLVWGKSASMIVINLRLMY